MTKRPVKEWVGKTAASMPSKLVRLRIFEAHEGQCHISKRKITPADKWELDHVVALCNGGENRESNLAPAIKAEHRKKTTQDVKQRAKNERIRAKHVGAVPKKPKGRLVKGFGGKITDRETGEVIREAYQPKGFKQ